MNGFIPTLILAAIISWFKVQATSTNWHLVAIGVISSVIAFFLTILARWAFFALFLLFYMAGEENDYGRAFSELVDIVLMSLPDLFTSDGFGLFALFSAINIVVLAVCATGVAWLVRAYKLKRQPQTVDNKHRPS